MSIDAVSKKLFTVDEYHRMAEAGILPETRRFELIRGEIIQMPTPGSPHASRVKRLIRVFTSRLGEIVIASVQDPLSIDLHSEPMPDVVLLRPQDDFYEAAHPTPQDVFLVVEVSHKSVRHDAKVKAPLYAEAGIPEYWQLDVIKETLTVRSDPEGGEYRSIRILRRGETIRAQAFPTIDFTVNELLG